jgi:hypothetical protein
MSKMVNLLDIQCVSLDGGLAHLKACIIAGQHTKMEKNMDKHSYSKWNKCNTANYENTLIK